MREGVTELIVGLAISLVLFAVVIGVIEIVVDRYIDGSHATSFSPQSSRPTGARRWP
jgi:hypothetical protein